jgi:predicted nuclease of restriction endonuclease-like (RecB) superfamily
MNNILENTDYNNWLKEIKANIQQRQIKAAMAVNSQLINLYWELGKEIFRKQETAKWGTGFIDQLSKDLKAEFPDMGGFSRTNLFAVKSFYLFYNQSIPIVPQVGGQLTSSVIVPQLGGQLPEAIDLCSQIPWKHNVTIIQKIKKQHEALFYIQQTIENNWSRAVLEAQIETNLFQR